MAMVVWLVGHECGTVERSGPEMAGAVVYSGRGCQDVGSMLVWAWFPDQG